MFEPIQVYLITKLKIEVDVFGLQYMCKQYSFNKAQVSHAII